MSWRTIEYERRYADPDHAPDWVAEPPPRWKAEFAAWASAQLDELERRVRAERISELEEEVTPERLRLMAKGLRAAQPIIEAKMAGIRMSEPKADFNRMAEIEHTASLREATGQSGKRGRTASGADWHSPTAKAARDLWRLRQVILPRFWREAGKGGVGPRQEALAEMAAARHHGVKPSAVLSFYENERLASL